MFEELIGDTVELDTVELDMVECDMAECDMVECDMVEFTGAQLDERIRDLELQRRSIEAELALAISITEQRRTYVADGHRSVTGYLKATCNWSPAECARFRSAARAASRSIELGEAWASGRIGGAQVAELSKLYGNPRVADRLPDFVPVLVQHAEELPLSEFKLVVERFVLLADADGGHDDRDAVEQRTASVVHAGGVLDVRASGGDPLTSAEFLAIFERFVDAEFQKDLATRGDDDPDRPFARTGRQRRFDALVEMARSAAAHSGVGSSADPLVSILIDEHTMSWALEQSGMGPSRSLTGDAIDPFTGLPRPDDVLDDLLGEPARLLHRRCETTNGVPLHPVDVVRAALAGHVRRVVLGAQSVVVDMGRSARLFTGAARDAALLLANRCDHPGCDLPAARCQVDHSTEWVDDGSTDQDNGGVRCGHHNREKHRTKRRTRRATSGRVYTFRPDGSIILPVGCRAPRFEPDDDPDADDADADGWTAADRAAIFAATQSRFAALLTAA